MLPYQPHQYIILIIQVSSLLPMAYLAVPQIIIIFFQLNLNNPKFYLARRKTTF